jgi:hypothetical protein
MNPFIFIFARNMANSYTIPKVVMRKTAALVLIAAFSVTAFATLGDGKSKGKKSSLLNNKTSVVHGKFSLKSGYQYRGSQIINQQKTNNSITLNSVITYQKGNTTYIVPMKTTVLTRNVKVSVGIPQYNKK